LIRDGHDNAATTADPAKRAAHAVHLRAAFAAFGWRYVFLPHLGPAASATGRSGRTLAPAARGGRPAAPRERRQLLIVQEPDELRSLAVVLGCHTVLLPWWHHRPRDAADADHLVPAH